MVKMTMKDKLEYIKMHNPEVCTLDRASVVFCCGGIWGFSKDFVYYMMSELNETPNYLNNNELMESKLSVMLKDTLGEGGFRDRLTCILPELTRFVAEDIGELLNESRMDEETDDDILRHGFLLMNLLDNITKLYIHESKVDEIKRDNIKTFVGSLKRELSGNLVGNLRYYLYMMGIENATE